MPPAGEPQTCWTTTARRMGCTPCGRTLGPVAAAAPSHLLLSASSSCCPPSTGDAAAWPLLGAEPSTPLEEARGRGLPCCHAPCTLSETSRSSSFIQPAFIESLLCATHVPQPANAFAHSSVLCSSSAQERGQPGKAGYLRASAHPRDGTRQNAQFPPPILAALAPGIRENGVCPAGRCEQNNGDV